MTGAMLQQPLIGWILDLNWNGELAAGVRSYDAPAYAAGFTLVLAWLAVSFLATLATRETHARQCP